MITPSIFRTFSSLLTGKIFATRTVFPPTLSSWSFQFPPHRENLCDRAARLWRADIAPFSSLLTGKICATLAGAMTRVKYYPFSSLLTGKIFATSAASILPDAFMAFSSLLTGKIFATRRLSARRSGMARFQFPPHRENLCDSARPPASVFFGPHFQFPPHRENLCD